MASASLLMRTTRTAANPAFSTLRAAKTPTLRRFLATPATAEQPRLRIGSEAPNFQAKTTKGDIDFHQWLDGKWAILFSHPADFTPVCTTELGAFAKLGGEFEKRGVKMIGLVSYLLVSFSFFLGGLGKWWLDWIGEWRNEHSSRLQALCQETS